MIWWSFCSKQEKRQEGFACFERQGSGQDLERPYPWTIEMLSLSSTTLKEFRPILVSQLQPNITTHFTQYN